MKENARKASADSTQKPVKRVEVVIIGAGISGIGAAVRLLEQGITGFAVLEKAASVGGTWRDNTYPGCACDVPSALYSYSFAQKPDWSRVFAGQAEILEYVKEVADGYGVHHYIEYEAPVEHARWDDQQGHWVVTTPRGVWQARVLISCTGYLHEPQIPAIPGLAEFQGKLFHSSRWDHAHDLRGERVAVIGTGASAIQFVPEIQPAVAQLHLFQRTPQWILPKPDAMVPALPQRLLALPFASDLFRGALYSGLEVFGVGFRRPAILKQVERLARLHLEQTIVDPVLRAKLTPDYVLGCKRVLLSSNYYQSVVQPNVEVLATGVKSVRGRVLVGQDGSEREVDTVILGTGFHVSDPPNAAHVHGKDGRSLADVWQGSPQAYRGTTVSGFPNFFLVLGPNLAIGNNSAFVVIESQLNYIMGALAAMKKQGIARLEVRAEVQLAYNREVQRDLQGTVWNTGGCSSYYIDTNGRNSIGFPWSTETMRKLLAEFDVARYATVSDAMTRATTKGTPQHA